MFQFNIFFCLLVKYFLLGRYLKISSNICIHSDSLLQSHSTATTHFQVKMIMATNRPDTLDPALLRPGRLDRKIEIPLPNEQARLEILKIHAGPIAKHGDIDYEAVVKLSDTFNGADLRLESCLELKTMYALVWF